jgi:hypothetical protein
MRRRHAPLVEADRDAGAERESELAALGWKKSLEWWRRRDGADVPSEDQGGTTGDPQLPAMSDDPSLAK